MILVCDQISNKHETDNKILTRVVFEAFDKGGYAGVDDVTEIRDNARSKSGTVEPDFRNSE